MENNEIKKLVNDYCYLIEYYKNVSIYLMILNINYIKLVRNYIILMVCITLLI